MLPLKSASVITQVFNPIVELAIPTGIPTKGEKVGIETHPVIVEVPISMWSI